MTDLSNERREGIGTGTVVAGAAIALIALHAGLWFYFKARQGQLDERTSERLLGGQRR